MGGVLGAVGGLGAVGLLVAVICYARRVKSPGAGQHEGKGDRSGPASFTDLVPSSADEKTADEMFSV
jgi:hypothetical protein